MTVLLRYRMDFAVAGVEVVGAERHLAGEFMRKSSAWPSYPSFSYTSSGTWAFC